MHEQKLVTAWQSVETQQSFFTTPDPALFHFRPAQHQLCALGGAAPDVMAVWDLHREMCVRHIPQVLFSLRT